MESIKPDSDAALIGCLGGDALMVQRNPRSGPGVIPSLMRSLAESGRRVGKIFSAYPRIKRLALRMNARSSAKRAHPIANSEMKPSSEPFVQHQPAVHRLRQQIGHVLARRSDRLDPDNYPFGKPAVWLEI
jgi:hypothetical protein